MSRSSSAYVLALFAAFAGQSKTVQGGETLVRSLVVDGLARSYRVYVPSSLDSDEAAPVILAFHAFAMNAQGLQRLIELDVLAEREGFLVAYPNGTGSTSLFLTFNAGGIAPPFDDGLPDDVEFTRRLLDDLASIAAIDNRRIFAAGYSNGGMMCYRLAAQLSDRIAAIASIAGTQAVEFPPPPRPVPICHFHGSEDGIVPPSGPAPGTPPFITFLTLDETVAIWKGINGCTTAGVTERLPNTTLDRTLVVRSNYGNCATSSEIVVHRILGGGHTWPGTKLPNNPVTGRTSRDISANEILWEFFRRHPLED